VCPPPSRPLLPPPHPPPPPPPGPPGALSPPPLILSSPTTLTSHPAIPSRFLFFIQMNVLRRSPMVLSLVSCSRSPCRVCSRASYFSVFNSIRSKRDCDSRQKTCGAPLPADLFMATHPTRLRSLVCSLPNSFLSYIKFPELSLHELRFFFDTGDTQTPLEGHN